VLSPTAAGRFSMVPREQRTAEQAAVLTEITEGPRKTFGGPFVPLLRSPGLLRHLHKVGEHLRFEGEAGDRLTEFTVLLTARRWNQGFEWAVHAQLALDAGVDPGILEAIKVGNRPADMDASMLAVWDVFSELDQTTRVSDETFARAREVLGETALVELVTVMGYYTTLALVLNLSATPAPNGCASYLPTEE
jgi:4-carboxymuconolactone decarboxylase